MLDKNRPSTCMDLSPIYSVALLRPKGQACSTVSLRWVGIKVGSPNFTRNKKTRTFSLHFARMRLKVNRENKQAGTGLTGTREPPPNPLPVIPMGLARPCVHSRWLMNSSSPHSFQSAGVSI